MANREGLAETLITHSSWGPPLTGSSVAQGEKAIPEFFDYATLWGLRSCGTPKGLGFGGSLSDSFS